MTPIKVKSIKAKVRVSTVLLILAFLIVGVFALVVYSDPHILDPVNEVLWGQRPVVEPSREEILRWTTSPSFNSEIDNSIKMRFIPVPPLEVPITEMGKANPFVPVSP